MAVARGQITLTDLNDARTCNMFLGANKPLTQVFSQDGQTYAPNYTTGAPLVITPEMYISGVDGNQIAAVASAPTWTIDDGSGPKTPAQFGGATVDAGTTATPYALKITKNMGAAKQWHIVCEATWTDSVTNLSVKVKSDITFTKNVNNGSLAYARIDPSSLVFKKVGGVDTPATITLTPVLVRGGDDDTTPKDAKPFTAQWFKQGSGTPISGTADGTIDANTFALTIKPEHVVNVQTYICKITDTYAAGGTNGKTFKDAVTIADMTDPYSVEITSSNGKTFKNGTGGTVLTARVNCGGGEVTSGITYQWYKTPDGGVEAAVNGATGKTLNVNASDISVKATYTCVATIS